MRLDGTLTRCLDGATGVRAELQLARDWLEQASPGESADLTRAVLSYGAYRYGWLCGAENLINRFRTECYQLGEPSWQGVSLEACPALGGEQSHSESFGDLTELRCSWCGARPFWPAYGCGRRKRRIGEPVAGPTPFLCRHDLELVANWMTRP
jgi:hypothetical protein